MSAPPAAVPRVPRWYCAVVGACIVLGLALRAETFTNGMFSDDFVEAAMLDGVYPAPRGALDVFDFTGRSRARPHGVDELRRAAVVDGPGLRLAMLRPLPSALSWFDHAVFGPQRGAVPRAFGVVVGARGHHGRGAVRAHADLAVAALGVLVFALEEAHTLPLGWLANRSAPIAMVFATGALVLHVRARDGRGRAWPSAALLSVALCAGEWAFPFLGYFVAYECVAAPGGARERVRALGPAFVLGAVYLGARRVLGYGKLHSGVYIDPLHEPLQLMVAALHRIPVFCADLVLGVPAMWWDFGSPWSQRAFALGFLSSSQWKALPSWRAVQLGLGVLALVAVVCGLCFGLRAARDSGPRRLAYLLLGAMLSLVPMVSSFPTSRLVLPAAIGVSACIAALIEGATRYALRARAAQRIAAALAAALALALAYVHVIEAARTSHADVDLMARLYRSVRRSLRGADIGGAELRGRRVIQLSAAEHTNVVFLPFVRHALANPCRAVSGR